MKMIRYVLAVMALIFTNPMVDAKLTIGFVKGSQKYQADDYSRAKIRKAFIEVNGESWFRSFVKDNLITGNIILALNIGKGDGIVIEGLRHIDSEQLVYIKEALDYLSSRNETLYYPINDGDKINTHLASDVVRKATKHRLIAGHPKGRMLTMLFDLRTSKLGDEYEEACMKNGCLNLKYMFEAKAYGKDNIRQKDIDLFVTYMIKADNDLLSNEIDEEVEYHGYSYECDKDTE